MSSRSCTNKTSTETETAIKLRRLGMILLILIPRVAEPMTPGIIEWLLLLPLLDDK